MYVVLFFYIYFHFCLPLTGEVLSDIRQRKYILNLFLFVCEILVMTYSMQNSKLHF